MEHQLSEAWGDFLSQYQWEWFMTLTFREPVPSYRAYRLFRRYVADIRRAAGIPIAWFMVFEHGAGTGRLHIHALLLNVAHLSRLWWMDEWDHRAGWARILPFDHRRGAAYYCAKYVTKGGGEWDLDGLPIVFQASLPLPISARPARVHEAHNDIDKRPSGWHSESVPEVRRRRPEKLCTRRRDWEEEMLRKGERWS
jgi:hypothetical protein